MCQVLKIPRSTFYYKHSSKAVDIDLTMKIIESFNKSRKTYGTRRIKQDLIKLGYYISRRRIGKIMAYNGLISCYTQPKYKNHRSKCNEDNIPNILDRKFDNQKKHNIVVSDLTYVKVANKWCYICIIIDLFNREIIGASTSCRKDSRCVIEAFSKIKFNLEEINIFHTDRGREFKNSAITDLLKTFSISRSLSKKGCPYDNAVSESTFKTVKKEFIKNRTFSSLQSLTSELNDYVHWFNNYRMHSSLHYMAPIEYKKENLKNIV